MTSTNIRIEPYTPDRKAGWDEFVAACRQPSFILRRDYMDYHADRFADCSLMAYSGGRLMALLPASRVESVVCSHGGLTYGGWLTCAAVDANMMLRIFDSAGEHLRRAGIERVVYRQMPHIYHTIPSEEDVYALFRCGASLSASLVSSAVDTSCRLPFNKNSLRHLRKAAKEGLRVGPDSDLGAFWAMLEEVLMSRHGARPVHTLAEMAMLASRFPANIHLYTARDAAGEMVAGTVIYATPRVWHAQYIAASAAGRESGALAMLFDYLLGICDARWLDLGTSNEDSGRYLNEGLLHQKAGFGARAVCYNTYTYSL